MSHKKKNIPVNRKLILIDEDYYGKVGLSPHNECKKDYISSVGNHLGCGLVMLCVVIKISGELQQPNPSRMIRAKINQK